MSKAKQPPLVTVTFLEQWRGHDRGAVAELTQERADELLSDGIVTSGRVPLPKPAKAAAAKATDDAGEEEAEASTPATPAKAPKRAPAAKKK